MNYSDYDDNDIAVVVHLDNQKNNMCGDINQESHFRNDNTAKFWGYGGEDEARFTMLLFSNATNKQQYFISTL